jgi:predicted nucleic acid-binding protein
MTRTKQEIETTSDTKRNRGSHSSARQERQESLLEENARAAPPDDRMERIALNAYYRSLRRGFEPGGEVDDWLAAEAEVDGQPLK